MTAPASRSSADVGLPVGLLRPGYRHSAAPDRSRAAIPARAMRDFWWAFASCQQWTQGLWTAYQHMSEEDIDLVIHLGDYIYEQGYRGTVRKEGMEETFTLADYRNRHAYTSPTRCCKKRTPAFPGSRHGTTMKFPTITPTTFKKKANPRKTS